MTKDTFAPLQLAGDVSRSAFCFGRALHHYSVSARGKRVTQQGGIQLRNVGDPREEIGFWDEGV